MSSRVGWGLAALCIGVGYLQFGWKGAVLGVTVVVFWLLLQFSRTLRVMRDAGGQPVGAIDSAVMLQSKLKPGMTLLQVIALTHSLGRAIDANTPEPERWSWADAGGVTLTLSLRGGKLTGWELTRPEDRADDVAKSAE